MVVQAELLTFVTNSTGMKYLLSLPPNVVGQFHQITDYSKELFFCTSDPVDQKLGSGGGTTWLLEQCAGDVEDFGAWLAQEQRILLHAGGQSRRLPAYAACGKVLLPVPVFRWARGQQLDQNLLDLQLPLYRKIMATAPASMHTLIASGDVYIRATERLQPIPEADVVCYGLWAEPTLAKNHGVFLMDRKKPETLDFVLQKPSVTQLGELMKTHLSLMDIGIWLLNDKAVEVLRRRSYNEKGERVAYDLYSEFGGAMGEHPRLKDEEINGLRVAVLPLPGGEFYHFGTTPELLSSTLALQNLVKDQRKILQKKVKQQPSVFTQNARVETLLTETNENIWLENAHVGRGWQLTQQNVVTGVPENDWVLKLERGQCVDLVPCDGEGLAVRPYGYEDAFRGPLSDPAVKLLGCPVLEWLERRGLRPEDIEGNGDLQTARLFPVCRDLAEAERLLKWMLAAAPDAELRDAWLAAPRLSADEIATRADLSRLEKQRRNFRKENLEHMARNYHKSVFYQVNLDATARMFKEYGLALPERPGDDDSLMLRVRDAMFRSRLLTLNGEDGTAEEERAFALLREGLTAPAWKDPQTPHLSVCRDQIVWGRSAVRIDLAGGWTDTPPFCLCEGGDVINMAIELNGQQPLQVYVKPSKKLKVICRSIDLGAMEVIDTYEELEQFNKVGSPFSIPKAALALCGFLPAFSAEKYGSLREQLAAFGCGIEITLLSAIPAGSGLGTSSILAATVLGALSDFCGLNWDKTEVGNRTLVLEQLLTTGGGWQDQYGGILHGLKLLQTKSGFEQTPVVRWLPDTFFKQPEYRSCHLLYYTGVTRTAKNILAEIVRSMFLNQTTNLGLLADMKQHALEMYDVIQRGDFAGYGKLLRKTWSMNKRLDAGTEPPVIAELCRRIDDLCAGYKLPGAGGGGYLYMVAKDPEAAVRIRETLLQHPLTDSARFVEMKLSTKGLQISRS